MGRFTKMRPWRWIKVSSLRSVPPAKYSLHTIRTTLLEGDNRVVMPGLVNGHSHAAMTLLRGMAEDMALLDWLTKYIFPAEIEFVDAEFVRIGTELACWEMIRGGTTTFVDMYYYPDVIAEVVESCGMRALVSATVIERPSPGAANAADSIEKAWHSSNAGRAKIHVSHPYSVRMPITP